MKMSIENIRIKINKKYHNIYRELTTGSETSVHNKIFERYGDLFTFCSVIGYKNESKLTFKGSDLFWSHSLNTYQETVVKAIALKDKSEYSVLNNPSEIISINEQYAEGGMSILCESLFKDYLEVLDGDEYTLNFTNEDLLEKTISLWVLNESKKTPF
jgi:dnd system-associated protein 4